MVFVEAGILAADERIHEILRDLIVMNHHPVLPDRPAVKSAVAVIDGGALGHLSNRRKIEGQCPEVVKQGYQQPEEEYSGQ